MNRESNFQGLPNFFECLWILCGVVLASLSLKLDQAGPLYTGGEFYIAFHFLYILTLFLLKPIILKKITGRPLRLRFFILGSLPILSTIPLFENDHYRYLWEGKAWLQGINPYRVAVDELPSAFAFKELRELVAFGELTSVYPLLSQFWFSLFGVFPWKVGLSLLQIANAVLCYFLFNSKSFFENRFWCLLFFPFFMKEFIQSVHIDLLAALVMLCLFSSRHFLWGVFLSFHMKIISVAVLPFLILRKNVLEIGKDKIIIFFLSMGSSVFIFLYIAGGMSSLEGAKSFGELWVWNAGFYSILLRIFPDSYFLMRLITFFAWVLILGGLGLYELKGKRRLGLWRILYIVFASLMFFSPVYNSWYAVWFILPAFKGRIKFGILYGLMSFWGYLYHGQPDLLWVSQILGHIFFLPSMVEAFYTVELQEDPPSTQNLAQKL